MDVYAMRPAVPDTWPPGMKQWGTQALRDKAVPVLRSGFDLLPELDDVQACSWWLPLPYIVCSDGTRIEPREGSVVLAWPDGSVHIGAPPRRPGDVITLYLAARIALEHSSELGTAAGVRSALAGVTIQ